jgi:hypothetical protein
METNLIRGTARGGEQLIEQVDLRRYLWALGPERA